MPARGAGDRQLLTTRRLAPVSSASGGVRPAAGASAPLAKPALDATILDTNHQERRGGRAPLYLCLDESVGLLPGRRTLYLVVLSVWYALRLVFGWIYHVSDMSHASDPPSLDRGRTCRFDTSRHVGRERRRWRARARLHHRGVRDGDGEQRRDDQAGRPDGRAAGQLPHPLLPLLGHRGVVGIQYDCISPVCALVVLAVLEFSQVCVCLPVVKRGG